MKPLPSLRKPGDDIYCKSTGGAFVTMSMCKQTMLKGYMYTLVVKVVVTVRVQAARKS